MIEISVIVPTRNRHKLLPRALKSLYLQTCKNFEIILVDDNDFGKRVRQDRDLWPLVQSLQVKLVENPNPKNAARARNLGLEVAEGRWITYLDDDDCYLPQKLEKQLKCASETNLPLGLCGLTYNLRRRHRVKQTSKRQYSGDELLLEACPDTKAIFHLSCDVRFDESLQAAEDLYFFHQLLDFFGVDNVFNVPEPLVEVYPQVGQRVNLNGEVILHVCRKIYFEFGSNYSEKAALQFLTRAELQAHRFRNGQLREFGQLMWKLLRVGGLKEVRGILNAFAFKIPWLRQFLVS